MNLLPSPGFSSRKFALRSFRWQGRTWTFAAFLIATLAVSRGAPLEADLGQGLSYLRPIQAEEDIASLRAPLSQRGALILDFRGVKATPETAHLLRATLQSHAATDRLRFILINESTSLELRAAATARLPGIVSLAPASENPVGADVSVITAAQLETRAIEIIEKGGPVTQLLPSAVEKERYDEASLVRDHAQGKDREPPPTPKKPGPVPAIADKNAESATEAEANAPVVDAVLHRAVQLHRTLLALKKP